LKEDINVLNSSNERSHKTQFMSNSTNTEIIIAPKKDSITGKVKISRKY